MELASQIWVVDLFDAEGPTGEDQAEADSVNWGNGATFGAVTALRALRAQAGAQQITQPYTAGSFGAKDRHPGQGTVDQRQ